MIAYKHTQGHRSLESYNVWPELKPEIDRNTQKRIKWKQVLGMSLTKAISLLRNEVGDNPNYIHWLICDGHPELDAEQKRRMWIGIRARIGENQTMTENVK